MPRTRRLLELLTILLTGAGAARGAEPAPDYLVVHARIHTQDARRTVVEAMAIRGHDVVATGSTAAMRGLAGPATRTLDLGGRVVLPGLIDAHTHPAVSALNLDKCNLGDRLLSRSALLAAVRRCYRDHPGDPHGWFEVVQVNPSGLVVDRADLDAISGHRPLLLNGSDGHTLWANSAALAAARIDAQTPDPPAGRIEHDASGEPTGTLRDQATYPVLRARPAAAPARAAAALARALGQMRADGITSLQDASVGDEEMNAYRALYDAGTLRMRVRGCYLFEDLAADPAALLAGARGFSVRYAIDPDYLRADAVKIFADGVIEYPSQTAALLEPYLDSHGVPTSWRGPDYYTQDHLNALVDGADAAGLTVHIHAIGDRAIRSSLDAFAYARAHGHGVGNRDQIAHLELIDPADVPRFRELDVIANFQLQWATFESYVETATVPYIGAERARHLYPARAVRDAGARIAGGSDWDVSTFDPFEAIEHAVTRSARRGAPALLADESVTLEDMIDAYTINAAYALRQDATTGSLEPGKRADFIVLDRDIYALDPYRLHSVRVLSTYLDGRPVYVRNPASARGAAH